MAIFVLFLLIFRDLCPCFYDIPDTPASNLLSPNNNNTRDYEKAEEAEETEQATTAFESAAHHEIPHITKRVTQSTK